MKHYRDPEGWTLSTTKFIIYLINLIQTNNVLSRDRRHRFTGILMCWERDCRMRNRRLSSFCEQPEGSAPRPEGISDCVNYQRTVRGLLLYDKKIEEDCFGDRSCQCWQVHTSGSLSIIPPMFPFQPDPDSRKTSLGVPPWTGVSIRLG